MRELELSPCPTLGCTSYVDAEHVPRCARCRSSGSPDPDLSRCSCAPPHPDGFGDCQGCGLPVGRSLHRSTVEVVA